MHSGDASQAIPIDKRSAPHAIRDDALGHCGRHSRQGVQLGRGGDIEIELVAQVTTVWNR